MAMKRLPNGLWAIEPRRKEFFGMVHQLLPLAASVPPGVSTGTDPVQVDGQADFLVHATAAIYDSGEAKIQFQIVPDRNWFSAPVFLGALGSGQFPRWMNSPQLIPRSQTFTLQAKDVQVVPADNNIRILHIGQKMYDHPFEGARAYQTVLPYDFTADFTSGDGGIGPLAAGAAMPFAFNVFSDSDFDVYKISVIADGDATLQIETTGKALFWFNRACHIGLLGASPPNAAIPSGGWPFRLPSPCRVPASGSIVTTVADLSGAENRVQVIYHGLRMKPPGGLPVDPRSLVNVNAAGG